MSEINNILGDNLGFVKLVDSLGSDLTIVNSARVSFGKKKDRLDEKDVKLIKYLVENKHWSPFRHVQLQFHIKAPEIVARQIYKHCIGSDYTFKDHAWNEISLRYVEVPEEFYTPPRFRAQADNNRQASKETENLPYGATQESVRVFYNAHLKQAFEAYKALLEMGVAREQARGLIPLSVYTEWYWTASFQAVANLIQLRDTEAAQWETRQYARAILSSLKDKEDLKHSLQSFSL